MENDSTFSSAKNLVNNALSEFWNFINKFHGNGTRLLLESLTFQKR